MQILKSVIKYHGQKEFTEERAYFICMFVCVCECVCVRQGHKICKTSPNYILHLASTDAQHTYNT